MKIRLTAVLLAGLLVHSASPPPVRAQSPDDPAWQKLAEAKPGHDAEHDVFQIDSHGIRYQKVRFRVHGPPVHFMHITVTFGNGDRQEFDLDKIVGDDQGTGALDLKGEHREIRQVDVLYKTLGHHRDSGYVSLWGYR